MFDKGSSEELREIFLNMTPFINIFICLLFFLLLGYKSQAVMLEGAKGIELPPSSSEKGLVVTLTISVGLDELKLQDSHVMYLNKGQIRERDLSGSKVLPLYNRMVRIVQLRKLDAKSSVVLLLADRRLKTDVLTKIMKTCGMAGIPNFHFGVARP